MEIKRCGKCGYGWEARIENPKSCPECKSRDWNKNEKTIKNKVERRFKK